MRKKKTEKKEEVVEKVYRKTVRTEDEKKDLHIWLNRVAGQIKGINKMVDDDRYCDDLLIQLSAVNESIKSLADRILARHMQTCVVNDIQNGNLETIDEMIALLRRIK